MNPQMNMPYDEHLDYSSRSFCTSIRIDEHDYPVAFQSEFVPQESALQPTGRMVVLLAHPQHGNILFYMRHHFFVWHLDLPDYTDVAESDDRVIAAAYPFVLTDAIVTACGDAIDNAHA